MKCYMWEGGWRCLAFQHVSFFEIDIFFWLKTDKLQTPIVFKSNWYSEVGSNDGIFHCQTLPTSIYVRKVPTNPSNSISPFNSLNFQFEIESPIETHPKIPNAISWGHFLRIYFNLDTRISLSTDFTLDWKKITCSKIYQLGSHSHKKIKINWKNTEGTLKIPLQSPSNT